MWSAVGTKYNITTRSLFAKFFQVWSQGIEISVHLQIIYIGHISYIKLVSDPDDLELIFINKSSTIFAFLLTWISSKYFIRWNNDVRYKLIGPVHDKNSKITVYLYSIIYNIKRLELLQPV